MTPTPDDHGHMDISEQLKTWSLFTSLVKWSIVANAALLLYLFFFRTHS